MSRIPGLKFDVGATVVYEKLDVRTVASLEEFVAQYANVPGPEWQAAVEHSEGEIKAHHDAVGKSFTVIDHIIPGANPYVIKYGDFELCISEGCLRAA